MAVTSEATTLWTGDLASGSGRTTLDSSGGVKDLPMSWAARINGQAGKSNPEELIGAAHSACYSMQFAHLLAENGTPPDDIQVTAAVTFEPGAGITGSHLLVSAKVPGISEADFERIADEAKATCPVSLALAGTSITLEASLA